MPPQPEYVLVRDKARELIYLAQEELRNNKPGLVCLLTYIAGTLLYRALGLRQGSSKEYEDASIRIDDMLVTVLFKNDRINAERCLDEAWELLRKVDEVFMERREEECGCWGE